MMKLTKIITVAFCLILFLCGCSARSIVSSQNISNIQVATTSSEDVKASSQGATTSSKDTASSSWANYDTKILYPDDLPQGEAINISEAVNTVYDKFKTQDNANIRYSCDRIDFINNRIYYIITRFEDKSTHTATVGYYAVDVFTGEAYDTKVLTDLIAMD